MKIFKTTLKRSLSVFLVVLMMLTSAPLAGFVGIELPELSINADASTSGTIASYASTDDVIICVPETIYMSPTIGASVSGQYFVNNIVDSSGKVTLAADRADTTGQISIYAPGATAFSLNVTAAVGDIGDPVIGSSNTSGTSTYEGEIFNFTAFGGETGYVSYDGLYLYIDGAGVLMGSTASIKWAVTLTYDTGKVTYYAYSTLYTPHLSVGAVSESRRSSIYNNEISSWISGVTGSGARKSVSSDRVGDGGTTADGYLTYDPLLTSTFGVGSSDSADDYVTSSTTIKTAHAVAVNGAQWTRSVGYLGYLTIDSSRYTNINQIPNLTIGADALRVNDNKKDSLGSFNAWYVVGDSSYTIGTEEDSTPSGWTQFVNLSEPQATSRNTVVPSYAVSSINGLYIHTVSQGYCTYLSSKNYATACASVLCTTVNKADLRKLVLQCSSLNKANYAYDWDVFIQAYENAAYVLGNPAATEHDISKAINFFYALPSIAKWNSAFEAGNSIVNITLTSDIILDGAPHSCLSAIPAGVTVNLNMNGYNIQWFDVDAENEDIISTSYPLSNNYWGLITNNGTLNISGTGTISSYHIRYNNENSANQDNYGAKSAAIVNNGTLTIGENVTVENYIGQANTEGKNYQDMFIYSHGVYNTGTVYSAGDIYSGAFAMGVVGGTISSNGYVCAYSYGIFGGSVTTTGGHIYSEAKSGFYVDTPFIITKRGNKSGNFAVGIYSNDAELYGNTAITTKSTSWRDDDSGYNIWRDGTNMSWGVGVMYSGNNYPYIGSAVNVDASFQLVADESTVSFPEYLAPIFYYSVNSNNGPETYDRRAYAVASVKNDLNAAMYGGQTAEILPWDGGVFGLSSSDLFTVTDYRSEYLSGGLETSTDNYTASGNNTNETLTSRLVNGYPASSGASLNINPYCATAAVEYARRYALAYNQEWHFYVKGGDCANYVSQALYAGGYQMTSLWHSYDGHYDNSEYYCYRTDEDGGNTHEWIRAEELRNYLVSTGGVQVHNPNKNDFSLGDAVFYDWDGDGEMDHSAIVTAIDNGTPKVSCHSTPEGDSKLDAHWTLGEASSCCYLIKLSGNTCNNDKANSYKYYLVNKATAVKSEVNSGSTLGTVYRYRTVRVISEYNGWGYINYLGKWGWVNLSNCTYKGSWSKIDVDHSMSGWYTYALPTCTNPGIMLNVCSKCGYTQRQNINVIAHKYTSATCTSASYCTMCGATSGSALGHDWTVTEIAPTCVKTGEKKSTCSRCGISKTETIATVDHTWGSYVTTTEPTCTKEGIATSTCSVCSKTQTKAIEALGHSMEEIEVDATCTVEGTTTSRCTRCGHTEYSDSSAALGHDYQATVTLATCTADGYTTYVCSRCNDTYVDSTSEWSDWTETYDETAPADKIKESNGLYSYIQTAWGHNFSVTDTADATCTEDGHTTQTCSRCMLEETEIVDALGHDWGEWTDNTDGTHSRICTRDSSHIETLDHVWYDGTMTVYPTCETEGTIEYTCEICGGVSTEAIDPIGHYYYLDESMSVEPTCAEDGYNYYVCANNPEHNYKENISATGHNMSETVDYPPEGTCGEGKKVSECTKDNCDYYEEEYYFFDHSYGDVIDVPGTCYMESYTYQECTKCGSTLITGYGETDPNNHSDCKTRTENVSDPTCTEPGYTGDTICEGCGKTITIGEEIPALGHDWGDWADNADGTHMRICNRDERHTETTDCAFSEWVIIKEPTCTETGAKERECSDCGYIESAEISILAHDYIGVTTAPTCTDQGYTIYTCSECGDTYTDNYVDATDHDWGEWTTVTPATCEEDGLEKRICKNDSSHVEENVLPTIGHDWDKGIIDPSSTCTTHGTKTYTCQNDASHTYTEEVALDKNNHVGDTYIKDAKEPDCTNDGYTGDTYCSDCDKKLSDGEVIPSTDHDWGEWTTVTPATCEEDGLEKRICKNDSSHVEENVLEKTGHDWDNGVIAPDSTCTVHGTKTYTCQNDASHTYTEEVALDENNHVGDTYIKDNKDATCTQDGYTGDTYCADCDKKIAEGEAIPATDHAWGDWTIVTPATCEADGLEKRICKNDASHVEENILPATGHDYVSITTAPTCTEQGYTTYTCSECGDAYTDDYVEAHDHDYHLIAEKSKAADYGVSGYDYYECSYDASHNYTVVTDPLVKTTYTATFVVTAPFFDEDKTVGTVTFEQGDKYVDEPSVENYKNYTFAWDEYELKDEDVVIYGRYTEIEIDGVSDVETNKNAIYNNGVATITLEAKSDTKNIKVLSENTKPVDVILVLDQSGSMAETLGGTNMTKQEALINCANSFVNEIYKNAVATGADHRVALVGFAYSDYSNGNYENTGILATTTGKAFNYADLTDTAYKTALIPVVSDNGINKYITNGIKNVAAEGATAADLGLEIANDIFAVTENDGTRERIVIFITDGTPTSWGETTDLVEGTSAAAITQSNRLKNQQGAKIYSVGVHANADPTANFTTVDSGVTTDNRNNFKSFDFNRFLHAVSSNYPESGSMKISELGTGSKDGGYYMGVNDTSNLSDIFSKILYSAVYEINTFDKVTLVDTISKEFTLTLEQEAEMRENLTSTLGIKNEDISVIRNTDGTTTVKFTNVRATKVYNNDGSSYYSASVSFDVSADADSLRGGNIATNTEDAYVDLGGTNIGSFTVPTVNIEQNRNIVVFTINGVVYRIDEAKLGDNIVAPESELAKWNIAEGTLVTENCAYFEASEVSDAKYTVTWISEGKQETQTYTFGSIITVPEAGEKAEYDFIKWSPDVPATMPASNMTFTAVYAPAHAHSFKKSYAYGDCEEGRTTVYVCSCGETKEETDESVSHTCEAVVTKTSNGTLVDRVSCTVCGKYVEQNLTYKVSYSQGWKTTVLDLTLYENEVTVQPDGTMKIMFYLGNAANKNYTVYRIDEDGTKTVYTPEKKNGYLIFDVDHFSIYVITEIDSDTQEPAEEIKYEQALCVLNGHSYTSEVTQATCTQNGYTTHICSNCGDTYTTDEISAIGHADNNGDNKCDACNTNVSEYCSCMCHKTGFLGFIWKILNFFYKLFGMNQTCDCGVAHW